MPCHSSCPTPSPTSRKHRPKARSTFYDWAGNAWVVLFSHPKDFTPVCTTELGAVARLKPEFDKRGVKVVGLSVDPVDRHVEWARDIERTQGAALNFPLIADADRRVANLLGLIHPRASDTHTVRSVFVIDPAKKVRLTITYPRLDRAQLRRDPPRDRQPPAHRPPQGGDAGRLEAGRGRDHPALGPRRGGARALPARLGRADPLSAQGAATGNRGVSRAAANPLSSPFAAEIADAVSALNAARSAWRQRQAGRHDVASFPSPTALARAVEHLAAALFPVRLGDFRGGAAREDDFDAEQLGRGLAILREQVASELGYWQSQCRDAFDPGQADTVVRHFAATLGEARALIDSDVEAGFVGGSRRAQRRRDIDQLSRRAAVLHHRIAHPLHELGAVIVARVISELANARTGVDIHPGATIGPSFFIDHGTGVVIGETAIIGANVRLYQACHARRAQPAGPQPGHAARPFRAPSDRRGRRRHLCRGDDPRPRHHRPRQHDRRQCLAARGRARRQRRRPARGPCGWTARWHRAFPRGSPARRHDRALPSRRHAAAAQAGDRRAVLQRSLRRPIQAVASRFIDPLSRISGATVLLVPALADALDAAALTDRLDGLLLTGSRSTSPPRATAARATTSTASTSSATSSRSRSPGI